MVVAVVTSHLANSMKRQTELARKRENEMSDLYAFSRRLAAAPSAADIYRAIEEHLANLVQRKVVLFGAGSGRDDAQARRGGGAGARACRDRAACRRAAPSATTVDDGTGNIWLVRRVSQKTADFGVIAIDLGSVPAAAIDEVRQRVDDVLVGCRRHARAPRRRARAQRRQDALRDRAAAGSADRLGLATNCARRSPRSWAPPRC